jgi:26S proteasome regulatory subunit N6
MSSVAKAKTAKLSMSSLFFPLLHFHLRGFTVRTLLDCFNGIPGSEGIQGEVLQENIEWAKKEKRIFLKQSLEARLISL